jgi:hypothetical protein
VYSGASNPCKHCQQSHRNTVHHNKNQFGYHPHEPERDPCRECGHKECPDECNDCVRCNGIYPPFLPADAPIGSKVMDGSGVVWVKVGNIND